MNLNTAQLQLLKDICKHAQSSFDFEETMDFGPDLAHILSEITKAMETTKED